MMTSVETEHKTVLNCHVDLSREETVSNCGVDLSRYYQYHHTKFERHQFLCIGTKPLPIVLLFHLYILGGGENGAGGGGGGGGAGVQAQWPFINSSMTILELNWRAKTKVVAHLKSY